jgi:hypothetical protein
MSDVDRTSLPIIGESECPNGAFKHLALVLDLEARRSDQHILRRRDDRIE